MKTQKMTKELKQAMADLGRQGAKKRWKDSTKEQRSQAASNAAKARWANRPPKSDS